MLAEKEHRHYPKPWQEDMHDALQDMQEWSHRMAYYAKDMQAWLEEAQDAMEDGDTRAFHRAVQRAGETLRRLYDTLDSRYKRE